MGAGKLRIEMMVRPRCNPKKQNSGREVGEWLRACAVDKWGGRQACCSWQLLWAMGMSYSLEGKVYVVETVLDVW